MRLDRLLLVHLLWLLPVAFWPGSNSYDSIKFTILALAAAFWLGRAAWLNWNRQGNLIPGLRGLVFAGSLVFVLGVGIFTAANSGLVLRTGLLIFLYTLITIKTMEQKGGLARQTPLLAALTAGAAVTGLYGLLQMAHLLPGAPASSGYPPGISTLGNQNYLAGFMAASIWPALVLLRQTTDHRARVFSVSALLILMVTLGFAGATGPQVAVLTAAILVIPPIVLVLRKRSRQAPVALGGLILLVGAVGLGLMGNAASSQLGTTNSHDTNSPIHRTLLAANHGGVRLADWLTAIHMIQTEPLGIGAGNYLVQWPSNRANLNRENAKLDLPWGTPVSTRAHNDFLQWMAETGVLGITWLALALAALAWYWRRRFLSLEASGQVSQLLLTGGILTVAVHSLVSFPFHLPVVSLVVAFLMGLIFINERVAFRPMSPPVGRVLGLSLAAASGLLLFGCLQEFRGDLLTASGSEYFARGKMRLAVAQLEEGTRLMKWPGHGHLYLGLARSALGQDEKAEWDLKLSLHDRPSFEAHLALAESAITRGDFSAAKSHLELVKACRPQLDFYHQAEYLNGLLLVRQGHLEAAGEAFAQLLREDPERHRAILGLGYLETLQGRPEAAEKIYSHALAVIDEKIAESLEHPGPESASNLIRLKQNRTVALRALKRNRE